MAQNKITLIRLPDPRIFHEIYNPVIINYKALIFESCCMVVVLPKWCLPVRLPLRLTTLWQGQNHWGMAVIQASHHAAERPVPIYRAIAPYDVTLPKGSSGNGIYRSKKPSLPGSSFFLIADDPVLFKPEGEELICIPSFLNSCS